MPRAQFVFLRLLVSAYILYLEAISAKVRQFGISICLEKFQLPTLQCARAVPRPYSRRNSMQPMPHRDSWGSYVRSDGVNEQAMISLLDICSLRFRMRLYPSSMGTMCRFLVNSASKFLQNSSNIQNISVTLSVVIIAIYVL